MVYDFCIIGGGIVGLSTAYKLKTKFPMAKIVLIEKEKKVAMHQTGRNSGVVHAGIYYKNGSLKSIFCKQGLKETYNFAQKHSINYRKIGKLIVATNDREVSVLESLYNEHRDDVNLRFLTSSQTSNIEPNLSVKAAILSPETGIIDWQKFSQKIYEDILKNNVEVITESEVAAIIESSKHVELRFLKSPRMVKTKKLICCGGLNSDRLAKLAGVNTNCKVIPFKGTYFYLKKEFSGMFERLIYPTPNLDTPFLGIHLTKHIDGSVSIGPSASLSLSREGYTNNSFTIKDSLDIFFYKGFWKFLVNNKKFILNEALISFSKNMYLKQCKNFIEQLSASDIVSEKCGIRAQAVDSNGKFIHDFLFANTEKTLHVINVPSPAATSAFPIADFIIKEMEKSLR